jgi:electron transfer flavoprotein alpha/beta subunit
LPKKKKRGWSLKRIRLGFNVLIGKVDAEFERNQIPRKPSLRQRSRIKKEVGTELLRLSETEKQPPNIVAKTFSEIAEKERKKAIRSGDYGTAIVASIIQYYVEQSGQNQPTPHW